MPFKHSKTMTLVQERRTYVLLHFSHCICFINFTLSHRAARQQHKIVCYQTRQTASNIYRIRLSSKQSTKVPVQSASVSTVNLVSVESEVPSVHLQQHHTSSRDSVKTRDNKLLVLGSNKLPTRKGKVLYPRHLLTTHHHHQQQPYVFYASPDQTEQRVVGLSRWPLDLLSNSLLPANCQSQVYRALFGCQARCTAQYKKQRLVVEASTGGRKVSPFQLVTFSRDAAPFEQCNTLERRGGQLVLLTIGNTCLSLGRLWKDIGRKDTD